MWSCERMRVAETLIAQTQREQNETKPPGSPNCADQKHAEETTQLQRCVTFHEKGRVIEKAGPGTQETDHGTWRIIPGVQVIEGTSLM